MERFEQYDHLIRRSLRWSVADLGDLLREVDRDPVLSETERSVLRTRLYRRIWDRAHTVFADTAAAVGDDERPHSDEPDEERMVS